MRTRVKKPADISQEDWESVDVPEATDAEFATARPFKEVFPAQYKAWKRMGRPPVETPKIHIGFRLAADVVQAIRATGRGYNARVEKVLEAFPGEKGAARQARFLCDKGGAALAALRAACDRGEETVEHGVWPLPKYREMLFLL